MPRYFLDSRALVKRYRTETGTDTIEHLFAEPDRRILVSRLALVEFHSCFARLVREGALSEAEFGRLVARLKADVANRVFFVTAVSGARLQDASNLLATYALTHPIRALDAIQLATAQGLHRRTRLAGMVAADKRLLASASACGLPVIDVG
jgi:uncharacterized protein